MRNFATAAPDGVKRSSGSSTRLPTRVMTVSPAAMGGLPFGVAQDWTSAHVRAHLLRAQDVLVQVELAVQLVDGGWIGRQVDHSVDAFGRPRDRVGEARTTPQVDLLHGAAVLADDVEELVE